MRRFFIICSLIFVAACSSKKEGNMIVQGQIKGLKKGTLYLQKIKDTILVNVDSITLLGKDVFTLSHHVDSPEMYYLNFDANNAEKKIMFFGEPGIISIEDTKDKFGIKTKIEGSKTQDVYKEYLEMSRKFQNKNLDLVKESFEAQKDENLKKLDSVDKASKNLIRRRYLYATNFAMTHGDSETAPYIALTDLVDANITLLDTIYTSLSDDVKASLYGKKLEKFIEDIKASEKEN